MIRTTTTQVANALKAILSQEQMDDLLYSLQVSAHDMQMEIKGGAPLPLSKIRMETYLRLILDIVDKA